NLSDLHEWGCTVWVKIDSGKLEAKAAEGRFVGYDAERKGYRVYWAEKRKITVERNVRFTPDEFLVPETIRPEGEQPTHVIESVTPNVSEPLTPPQPLSSPLSSQQLPLSAQPEAAARPARLPDGLDPPLPNTG